MKYLLFNAGCVSRILMRPEEPYSGSGDGEGETIEGEEESEEGEEEPEDGEEEPEEDEGEGGRAQKRIRELVEAKKSATAEIETLKKQLEDAKKLSGDDGKALIRAAEASGILPEMMTKQEAEAFEQLECGPRVIEHYESWLEEHEKGDVYQLRDGKTLEFVEVKRRVRELKAEQEELKERYGARRSELKAKLKAIFEIGLAATKAGWKPEDKKVTKKKTLTKPEGVTRVNKRGEDNGENDDVNNEDDLEAFFTKARRKKK